MKTLTRFSLAAALSLGISTLPSYTTQPVAQRIKPVSGTGSSYILTKEAGERQLAEVVKNSKKEDSWMCVENKNGTVWYDVGYNETSKRVISKRSDISKRIAEGDFVTFYHIHPTPNRNTGPSIVDFKSDSVKRELLRLSGARINPSVVFTSAGKYSYATPENHKKFIKEGVNSKLTYASKFIEFAHSNERVVDRKIDCRDYILVDDRLTNLSILGYTLYFERN